MKVLVPGDELTAVINQFQMQKLANVLEAHPYMLTVDLWHLENVDLNALKAGQADWRSVRDFEFGHHTIVTYFDYHAEQTIYHWRLDDGATISFPFRWLEDEWRPMDYYSVLLADGRGFIGWNGHPDLEDNDEVVAGINNRDQVATIITLCTGSIATYVKEHQ